MVSLPRRSPSTALRSYKGCMMDSSFPLSAPITSAPPSSHHPLYSTSCHAPLFQALSATVGSRCYRFVHLCVVFDWGSTHQTGHRSEPTRQRPSHCSPLPRTSTTAAHHQGTPRHRPTPVLLRPSCATVLSTVRTLDSFLTQQPAPTIADCPLHVVPPPTDHTSPWSSFF
jgi:hypothetical protein